MQRSSAFLVIVLLGISHYTISTIINLEVGLLVAVSSNDDECNQTINNNMSYWVITLEAYRFGIQKANRELEKIGINLQPKFLPYCNKDELVYRRIINITLDQQKAMCSPGSDNSSDNMIAVIASTPSNLATTVTAMLQEICVPLIASVATDPNLNKFPYFVGTMPNDEHQAKFLWQVLKFMNATPALILYDSSGYASRLLSKLRDFPNPDADDFCIEEEIQLATENDHEYEHIMERLNSSQAVAVVLLTNFNGAQKFFTYLQKNATQLSEKFKFLGPDAWCGKYSREEVPIPESSIGVMPYLGEDAEFKKYLTSITLKKACEENKLDLAGVIAEQLMCKDPCGAGSTCNKSEKLFLDGDGVGAMFRAKFFIESIMQLKEALLSMFKSCNSASTCPEIWANFSGHNLVDYMNQSDPNKTYGLFRFSEDQHKWEHAGSYDISASRDFNTLDANLSIILAKLDPIKEQKQDCNQICPATAKKVKSTKCCHICTSCSDHFDRVINNECKICPSGQVPDLNNPGICTGNLKTSIDIPYGSIAAVYALIVAGITLLLIMTVVILLKVNDEMRRLLCSEANVWYIIGALIHFVTCLTCIISLSDTICYVIWILSSFGSTVASAANLMHLIAYSYAPRQGDNRLYLPLLFRSCSSSQIRRRGVIFCLILAQALITAVVTTTMRSGSTSTIIKQISGPPSYMTTCKWLPQFTSVLLVLPICIVVLVLILAMQMTGIVISIVRRQIKNIWVTSMIVLLTDMFLLPILNSKAYNVAEEIRMTFFLVYSLAQGYILLLFLLVPFAYTVLWRQSRFSSGTANVAVPTVRRN